MISITKLLCGTEYYGDSLRYSESSSLQRHGAAAGYGPVVAWNITRACNLRCRHCYASARSGSEGELNYQEAVGFLDDLAEFRVPALLLSGGEPVLRPDFFDLISYAGKLGLRLTLSTNGTLITSDAAKKIKDAGVSYVGVSLDGTREINDSFRGLHGAFDSALQGIRNCLSVGQKVGLRFTINRYNLSEIKSVFQLIETENIPRICFYHLAYAGRGTEMSDQDITAAEKRAVLDLIMERVLDYHRGGIQKEVLTVNNHADGVYVYLKLLRSSQPGAEEVYRLLSLNGGNRSGAALGAVDWDGNVHPDQFTLQHTFGNIKKRPFSEIWQDEGNPVMAGLRNRRPLLKGRCSACRWLDLCNGNSRTRAEADCGDFWASDPACYLNDQEIGL
ncbi:MAG: radical SAM protein [Eubacteriales bacterium]